MFSQTNPAPRGHVVILQDLAKYGWITLRSASVILGYNSPQALYMRQRRDDPIPTVRVDGTERVYEETLLELLETEDIQKRTDTVFMLSMYAKINREMHR